MRFRTLIHATLGPEWTLKFPTGPYIGPRIRRHGTFWRVSHHELVGTVLVQPWVDLYHAGSPDCAGAARLSGPPETESSPDGGDGRIARLTQINAPQVGSVKFGHVRSWGALGNLAKLLPKPMLDR